MTISDRGRKFELSLLGVVLVPLLALLKAPSDAYMALAAMVSVFCGANAAISYGFKGQSQTNDPAIVARRAGLTTEDTP